MNAVMETIYRKIEAEGVWLADPRQVTYEQQQAILALRKAGRIEQAAYGGLKIKRDWRVQKPAPSVAARLAALGIVSTREVVEVKGALKRPGDAPSWYIVLGKGAKVPTAAFAAFSDVYCEGRVLIVQFKVA